MRIKSFDVLRSIAIFAVFIFHVSPNQFPNAFFGVDIFFVLAGYLNCASLIRKYLPKNIVIQFFLSRIYRIYPNLILILLLFSPLVVFFDFSPGPDLRTALFGLIMAANVYLGSQQLDYFGNSLESNFFTTLWSLSLEMQFYLASFMLIFLCFKLFRKNIYLLLTLVAICVSVPSFYSQISLVNTQNPWYYFSFSSRIWEFMAGSIAFLLFSKNSFFFSLKNSWIYNLLVLGSLFILVILSFYPVEIPFVANILFAVLCSFLVVSISQHYDLNLPAPLYKLFYYLSWLSYSLFLVHWPLLILFKFTIGVSRITLIPYILFSILLAHIFQISVDYLFPPLTTKSKQFLLNPSIYLSFFLVPFLYLLNLNRRSLFLGSPPPTDQNQLLRSDYTGSLSSLKIHRDCRFDLHKSKSVRKLRNVLNFTQSNLCLFANDSDNLIIATGDSHSGMLTSLLEKEYILSNSDLIQIYFPSCAVFKPYPQSNKCKISNTSVRNLIANATRKYSKVILFLANNYIPNDFDISYLQVISTLTSEYPSLSILYFANAPIYPSLSPSNKCTPQWYRPFLESNNCNVDYASSKAFNHSRRESFIGNLRTMQASNENFFVYDAFDLLCRGSNSDFCLPYVTNNETKIFLYRDDNHLGSEGVDFISSDFENNFRKFNFFTE